MLIGRQAEPMRPRLDQPPVVYEATSPINARASQAQSHPTTLPKGATATNISVVQGRKTKPSAGQMKVSKAADQRDGFTSHQKSMPTRGPAKSVIKKRHMRPPPSCGRLAAVGSCLAKQQGGACG